MIQIYTDASTKGHPGPSGVGILIVHQHQQVPLSIPLIQHYTNHEAEFIAQILALHYLYERFNIKGEWITLYSDSKAVIEAQHKAYSKSHADYLTTLLDVQKKFPQLMTQWIPESKNKGADQLARQALAKVLKTKKPIIDPLNIYRY